MTCEKIGEDRKAIRQTENPIKPFPPFFSGQRDEWTGLSSPINSYIFLLLVSYVLYYRKFNPLSLIDKMKEKVF